jgi:hypothetical protein
MRAGTACSGGVFDGFPWTAAGRQRFMNSGRRRRGKPPVPKPGPWTVQEFGTIEVRS